MKKSCRALSTKIVIRKILLLQLLMMLLLLCSACSHSLDIKNLSSFNTSYAASINDPSLDVGIIPSGGDMYGDQIIKAVGEKMMQLSRGTVYFPYYASSKDNNSAKVIVSIAVKPTYEGSGYNFLINWPGFLIWAPAWHGYIYKVNFDTEIRLQEASTGRLLDAFTLPIKLDVRHAAINRTWTEIGWLEVGIIPLIGGIFFTQYDSSTTPEIVEASRIRLGEYIAQEIITRINSHRLTDTGKKAAFK